MQAGIWTSCFPGKGNSKGKDPEEGTLVVFQGNQGALTGVEGGSRGVTEDDISEVAESLVDQRKYLDFKSELDVKVYPLGFGSRNRNFCCVKPKVVYTENKCLNITGRERGGV